MPSLSPPLWLAIAFSLTSGVAPDSQQNESGSTDSLSAIIGIVGTVLGVILGAISIWLALYFYRRATEAERRADTTSQGIAADLQVIKQIHDRIYSDLFGMTKDAYADIRAKAFGAPQSGISPASPPAEIVASKADEAKLDMQRNFDQVLSRLDSTDNQVKALASITRPLIEKAVERGMVAAETARSSAAELDIRNIISKQPVTAETVMSQAVTKHTAQAVIESLRQMYAAGAITWSTPTLEADTIISIPPSE